MTEPTWLTAARVKLGVRETPGPANNPINLGWVKTLGSKTLGSKVLGIAFNADSVPWCGLFAAKCVAEAGLTPPPIAIRAASWATWGKPVASAALAPWAVLVFQRPGGGHVGFYVGEDATAYHVLGGNQSDAVTITRIAKGRCVARRWPAGLPVIGRAVLLAFLRPLSVDEARAELALPPSQVASCSSSHLWWAHTSPDVVMAGPSPMASRRPLIAR